MSENERPTRAEAEQGKRRRRESMGADRNLKLHVPAEAKDPDFEYRFINNRPGRVQQLTKQDDYDIVSASDMESRSIGTTVERAGNSRDGESMILVRKHRKYHEADKAAAAKAIDATEEGMRRGAPASTEGLAGPEAYVPGGRNVVAGK